MIIDRKFLKGVTGIGSLPYKDPETALDLIKKNMGEFPHWPQLPQRGPQEGFVEQFAATLKIYHLVEERQGKLCFRNASNEWPELLTNFYEAYLLASEGNEQALDTFGFQEGSMVGFWALEELIKSGEIHPQIVKGQLSGPITVGFQVKDNEGKAAYYDPQLRDIVVKTIEMQASWQAKRLSSLGLPVLIHIDDPGIYAYGTSTHVTLERQDIQDDLNVVFSALQRNGSMAGLHCCAGTDWSIVLESKADVLSFDAFAYFESVTAYTKEIQEFLNQGKALAWGIVPTNPQIFDWSPKRLYDLLEEKIEILTQKGIDGTSLRSQCIITPSCGTGLLETEVAETIYEYINQLSTLWEKHWKG